MSFISWSESPVVSPGASTAQKYIPLSHHITSWMTRSASDNTHTQIPEHQPVITAGVSVLGLRVAKSRKISSKFRKLIGNFGKFPEMFHPFASLLGLQWIIHINNHVCWQTCWPPPNWLVRSSSAHFAAGLDDIPKNFIYMFFSYVDFNICFMLVKHFELHFIYEKCYTNKLLLFLRQ